MKLIIAEKESVATTIAKALGATDKRDGYFEGGAFMITWCQGHLVGLSMPDSYGEQYANYRTFDNLPIIPQEWKFEVDGSKAKRFNVVKKLMNDKNVDEIISATDAGREGECIFRYVYNQIGCTKPVKRLWISSMELSAILKGMGNLQPSSDYDNLYAAGICRAKADWLVGMNGSRLFSNRYGDSLNVGRVQTPVLAMIVKRDYDIAHFVKRKFFGVSLNCGEFTALSQRIEDENTAKEIAEKCNNKTAEVTEVKKEVKKENPPKLYNLTTLQREANRQFGYTAKQTLDYLQSLYEAELATYPRTDSEYLTEDMEQTALDIINTIQRTIPELNFGITNPNVKRCLNNKKISDHTAVIPTAEIANIDLNSLPATDKNILLLISAKLLVATSKQYEYEAVKVTVNCENNDFYASGKTVISKGFKEIESRVKSVLTGNTPQETETKLPEISENQQFENVTSMVTSGFTTPPKSYTEDTLLGAMETAGNTDYDENSDVEKKGLGTPATRDSVIEHLIKHGYIVRDKKKITATEKGVNFIGVLPDEIKSAKLTADWETALQNIEKGEISPESFMSEIENFTKELVEKYSEKAENSPFAKKKEILGKCPRCGKNIYEGKQNYYCESGKEGCGFTVWKELKYPNTSVSPEQLKALLNEGKTRFEAVSKEGKKYTADFALEDTGKYINLVFLPAESEELGKCPKCGESVLSGKYGFYCKGKCSMNIGKVYGKELTEIQVKKLLEGKQITLVSSGNKTVVMPEVIQNDYNGKTYFQWKTKKG
ncbi:MAG: DNA topoisomerase 3 [Ruminococcus sp.]|nr:DNA topoisomerase 3 [Ruminococcus sp.]